MRKMKALCVLISVVVLLAGCSGKSSSKEKGELLYERCGLSTYKVNENFRVCIRQNDSSVGEVEFSSNRAVVRVKSINLIPSDSNQSFVNKRLAAIEEMFGPPHVDVGSGFYIPAYITEDAYLISMYLTEEDMIYQTVVRDLLTNEVV